MTKTEKHSSKVEVLRPFLNPLTKRLTTVGDCFNAPKDKFWGRRERDKDIQRVAQSTPTVSVGHQKLVKAENEKRAEGAKRAAVKLAADKAAYEKAKAQAKKGGNK